MSVGQLTWVFRALPAALLPDRKGGVDATRWWRDQRRVAKVVLERFVVGVEEARIAKQGHGKDMRIIGAQVGVCAQLLHFGVHRGGIQPPHLALGDRGQQPIPGSPVLDEFSPLPATHDEPPSALQPLEEAIGDGLRFRRKEFARDAGVKDGAHGSQPQLTLYFLEEEPSIGGWGAPDVAIFVKPEGMDADSKAFAFEVEEAHAVGP